MIKQFFFLLISTFISLTSCSTGANTSNHSPTSNLGATTAAIQISSISTIQAANFTVGENVPVNISNNTNDTITLQDTQITANGQIIAASAVNTYFLMNSCQSIAPHSSCTARAFTNPTFQSYLLNLTYNSSSGNTYRVDQVISFNKLLPAQNGFIYDATQLNSNLSGLTIPFRLAADYSKITVLVNNQDTPFSCYKNSYASNTLCSVNIKSTSLIAGNGVPNTLKISGYTNGNNTPITNSILILTNTQIANILTSGQNVVINPDDGTNPQTVYLVNNGLVAATGLTISPNSPMTISSNTCGTSLSAGASCSFVINVSNSPVSGQSYVAVGYSNGQNTQVVYFNVSYINQTGTPALTLTSSGNFNNLAANGGPFYSAINVTNSCNVNLTNLQFSNMNLQKSNMTSFATGSSCYNGINLNTGQGCIMLISYSPVAAESGTVNFIPTASYTGSGGESSTYANSILNISYLGISSPTYVAMGDYGAVATSTNYPPTTWSANIDSPFLTGTESATGIYINSGVYVIMKNTGVIESSTTKGLFWRQSGGNNFSSSTYNIIYDGTAYYTCGTVGTAFTGCATTGRGCIVRSTDLVTWTGLFQPAQAVPINNIYYYTNGTNKAYIATVASTTANTGLAVSTNGTTFVAPTSTGTTAANSNLIATAFNTSNNTITAWSSTGFNTTVAIASITGTWTANTTNRPANARVNTAIFQNGVYTVGIDNGNIYTSTTSTGTYTLRFTGINRISSIIYGNGIYLAVEESRVYESGVTTWFNATNTFEGGVATRLRSAYFESTNNNFWVGGGDLLYSTASESLVWQPPSFNNLAKNGTTYIAVDNMGGHLLLN